MSFRLKFISVASCLALHPFVLTASEGSQFDQNTSKISSLIRKFETSDVPVFKKDPLLVPEIISERVKLKEKTFFYNNLINYANNSTDDDLSWYKSSFEETFPSHSSYEDSIGEVPENKNETVILEKNQASHEDSIEAFPENKKETVILERNQENLMKKVPFLKGKKISEVFRREILDYLEEEEISAEHLYFFGTWSRLFPEAKDENHADVLKNRLNYASVLLLDTCRSKFEKENFIVDSALPFSHKEDTYVSPWLMKRVLEVCPDPIREEALGVSSDLMSFLGSLLSLTPMKRVRLTSHFSPFCYLLNREDSYSYFERLGREIGRNTSLTSIILDNIPFYSQENLEVFAKNSFKNKHLQKISFTNARANLDSSIRWDHFFERISGNSIEKKLWEKAPTF